MIIGNTVDFLIFMRRSFKYHEEDMEVQKTVIFTRFNFTHVFEDTKRLENTKILSIVKKNNKMEKQTFFENRQMIFFLNIFEGAEAL